MRTRIELEEEFKRLSEVAETEAELLTLDVITTVLNAYVILDNLESRKQSLGDFQFVPDLLWYALTNNIAGVRKMEQALLLSKKTGG